MGARERWRLAILMNVLWFQHVRLTPLIIAHRGSPCELPEETLEGFQQAIDDKADYIEMDVVSTKDGVLVCRHDLILDSTTDVALHEEFRDRHTTRTLPNGLNLTGYFVADFTLDEVKQLYATQSMAFRDHSKDSMYRIPTFAEVLQLALDNNNHNKPIGVYVEAKEPAFHRDVLGLPLESKIVSQLMGQQAQEQGLKVILQSFEKEALRSVASIIESNQLSRIPLIWLLGCDSNVTEEELDEFATFGHGLGPDKNLIIPLEHTPECGQPDICSFDPLQQCTGRLKGEGPEQSSMNTPQNNMMPSDIKLLDWARAKGLVVHAYTFRNEDMYMALDFRGDPHAELEYFAAQEGLALDGVFVDCSSTAVRWKKTQPPAKPHAYLPDLVEEQKPAPPWVSIIVVLAGVLLVLGTVIYGARFLVMKKRITYELLERDELELPVSRRAISETAADSPGVKVAAMIVKEK